MNTKTVILAVERHRAYIYRLAGTLGAVAASCGVLTHGQASEVLLVVGAVLGVGGNGLASAYTSTEKK